VGEKSEIFDRSGEGKTSEIFEVGPGVVEVNILALFTDTLF
jgi:hypothetical protein